MHHNGNKLLTDVTIIQFSLCFPLSFVSVIFIYSFLLHISFIYWNCIIRIIGRFARVHMFFFLSRSLISLIRNIPPKHTHSHIHTHKSIEKKETKEKVLPYDCLFSKMGCSSTCITNNMAKDKTIMLNISENGRRTNQHRALIKLHSKTHTQFYNQTKYQIVQ